MKHPHAEILKAYAADTSVKIEEERAANDWWPCNITDIVARPSSKYRLKPAMRSITLADGTVVSWPEPMRVAPAVRALYWPVNPWVVNTRQERWIGSDVDYIALKAGFCHATKDAAQQHRRAIVLANGGKL